MLVITRRLKERIHFPTLGVSLELLDFVEGALRLGIESKGRVSMSDDELRTESPASDARADHDFANVLSRANLAVYLARKQVEVGRAGDAVASLNLALESLELLEKNHRRKAPSARRCHALIVEDDINERELLAGVLCMNGCKCDQVGDGEDALAYLDAGGRPDVVLMDMAMPRCDGPATLRRIRQDERFSGLKVFLVSSMSPHEFDIPEGPEGFDAWFSKPLNPGQLWDAMQASLQ